MVLEVLVSVSHFAATAPAIVVVVLGATLFLVGIIAATAFFFRRRSPEFRKSGVYLTNRSPIAEEIPLRSQIIIRRRSDTACVGTGRTPHLVMKKSPSPPFHNTSPSSRKSSPVSPTEEMVGGIKRINRNAIAIHTNPICNTSTFCDVHGSTKCTHGTGKSSNHLVKRDKSPKTSPEISPSTSTPANLGMHCEHSQNETVIEIGGKRRTSIERITPATLLEAAVEAVPETVSLDQLAGGGQNGLGTLYFRIRYKEEKGTLVVTVVRCENLPVKDTTLMTCDPYVKLQLMPEKQQRVKTRVLRHTRQPIFEEDFTFYGIQQDQLTERTLHFVVLSFDRYSRDDVIGELFYPLESLDVSGTENSPLEISADIQSRNYKMQTQGRGEVLLSLCFQPTANRLTVVVLKARNLPKMDVSGLADPYVKVYLIYNGQRLVKKKTHVKKRTLNPVFNESFVFDLPPEATQGTNLDKVSLQVLLLDWDRVTKNEVIGKLELGSGSASPTATHHWNEVLNCPRRQIAEWHKLRD